jgi:hypothetical protein
VTTCIATSSCRCILFRVKPDLRVGSVARLGTRQRTLLPGTFPPTAPRSLSFSLRRCFVVVRIECLHLVVVVVAIVITVKA